MDEFEQDRKQLRGIQEVFENAVKKNEIENIKSHIDDEFSFVSFTDSAFDDFDSFQAQWKKTRTEMVGQGSFSSSLNPEPALFYGDIAVCKGNSDNHLVNAKGKSFTYTSNWTVVFRRHENGWKVLRAHNSLNPFDNPMLVDGVKSKVSKLAALAFVTGVFITAFFMYFAGK